MNGARMAIGVLVSACLLALAAGCTESLLEPRVMPYDAEDAVIALDVMPQGRYAYEDMGVPLLTDFDCWSKRTTKRMHLERGPHIFEYRALRETGEPIVFYRVTRTIDSASIQMNEVVEPRTPLPPGKYDIRVSTTTPSGRIVKSQYKRPFEVRRRELKLILTSDKVSYKLGEPIVLTGTVENISGEILHLHKLGGSEVRLEDDARRRMRVVDARVPKTMAVGAKQELCVLRFEAGKADARFSDGSASEFLSAPFKWPREYSLALHLELPGRHKASVNLSPRMRDWIAALPGTCSLRIEKPAAPLE